MHGLPHLTPPLSAPRAERDIRVSNHGERRRFAPADPAPTASNVGGASVMHIQSIEWAERRLRERRRAPRDRLPRIYPPCVQPKEVDMTR